MCFVLDAWGIVLRLDAGVATSENCYFEGLRLTFNRYCIFLGVIVWFAFQYLIEFVDILEPSSLH